MPTVRIQEKNYSESIMVLKLKDGASGSGPSGARLSYLCAVFYSRLLKCLRGK